MNAFKSRDDHRKASKYVDLPRLAACLLAILAGVNMTSCVTSVGDGVASDPTGEQASATGTDDAADFCDDENPCTKDVNCTPCSTLPEAEQDIYHCTPDVELPAACVGRTGCVHIAWTTPVDQTDDCFPVVGADEEEASSGVCRAGRCVANPT